MTNLALSPSGSNFPGTAVGGATAGASVVPVYNAVTREYEPRTLPASSSSSMVVASAIGRNTDNEPLPETNLYAVPVGESGLYRATAFIGPATTGGGGQVFLTVNWPAYPPGTGNLTFMSPAESFVQVNMLIGEGSTGAGVIQQTFWAQEGGIFTYEAGPIDFTGGDWVWAVALEKLVVFSNP
jgi:hypothetical protein